MQTDKTLLAALSGTGLPAYRIVAKFTNNTDIPEQYFVYAITGGAPFYDDDFLRYIEINYSVILFSRSDYTELLGKTAEALNIEGIKIQSLGPEIYDPEIDFYQITINISIILEG